MAKKQKTNANYLRLWLFSITFGIVFATAWHTIVNFDQYAAALIVLGKITYCATAAILLLVYIWILNKLI